MPDSGADELELVLGLLASLRDRVPPEVQQHLTGAARELLLALRAVIDCYLARTEEQPAAPGEATPGARDIPIL